MDGFDFGAPADAAPAPAPLDGFDFGAPAAPAEVAEVAPMDAMGGFDMGAAPAAEAPAMDMGAMDAMAGFAPEEVPDEVRAWPNLARS